MHCPQCQSTQVQRAEVIYLQGSTSGSSSGGSLGVGAAGGLFGVGASQNSSQYQERTLFAQLAAPPEKESYGWPIFWLLAGTGMLFGEDAVLLTRFFGAVFALLAAWVMYQRIQYNRNYYQEDYRQWQNRWLCHQCGAVLEQTDNNAEPISEVKENNFHAFTEAEKRLDK